MVWHKYGITNRSHGVSLNSNAAGTLAVGASLDTPADPLSSESPLFSQAQTYFRNGVHISVKMRRIEMQLCQKDVKLFSASIGRKQSASKLNTWVHFEDYQKIISMYRKLSLRTCDARWRSQPRPPSREHKPVSAQLFWLVQYMTLTFDLTHDLDLGCFKVKFRNSSISGIVGLIDVKWKGSELIWYCADCMTLPFDHTHDLELGVSRSESEKLYFRNGAADW